MGPYRLSVLTATFVACVSVSTAFAQFTPLGLTVSEPVRLGRHGRGLRQSKQHLPADLGGLGHPRGPAARRQRRPGVGAVRYRQRGRREVLESPRRVFERRFRQLRARRFPGDLRRGHGRPIAGPPCRVPLERAESRRPVGGDRDRVGRQRRLNRTISMATCSTTQSPSNGSSSTTNSRAPPLNGAGTRRSDVYLRRDRRLRSVLPPS